MVYANSYYNKDVKIPVWFAILFLLILIVFFNFFLNSKYLKISSKATLYQIRQIKIANVTNNQATIFWETSEKEKSYLILGENKNQLNRIYFDDREVSFDRKERIFHIVSLNNLQSQKEYYFKIMTEKGVYGDLEGQPFFFRTFSNDTKIFLSPPIYGKIVDSHSQGLNNAIIFLYKSNNILGVTYSKERGDWLVILKRIYQSFDNNEILKIEIYSEDNKKSVVEGKITQLSPLKETIIIGKNYSFLTEGQVLSSEERRLNSRDNFDIFFPRNNAIISGFRPLIKGTGLPFSEVNVTIKGKEIYFLRTKVDKKGEWIINLPNNLDSGQYLLEVIGHNEDKQVTKTRRFTIAKSGEQVLGEATPSAAITPSIIVPTLSFTPKPSIVYPTASTPKPTIYKSGVFSSFNYLVLSLIFFLVGGYLVIAQ